MSTSLTSWLYRELCILRHSRWAILVWICMFVVNLLVAMSMLEWQRSSWLYRTLAAFSSFTSIWFCVWAAERFGSKTSFQVYLCKRGLHFAIAHLCLLLIILCASQFDTCELGPFSIFQAVMHRLYFQLNMRYAHKCIALHCGH